MYQLELNLESALQEGTETDAEPRGFRDPSLRGLRICASLFNINDLIFVFPHGSVQAGKTCNMLLGSRIRCEQET
jgi:hypothetical protein